MPPNVVLAPTRSACHTAAAVSHHLYRDTQGTENLPPLRVDPLAPPPPPQPEDSLAAPLTRSVHVQTDYRDSEAQTEPYSPEYVVRPGSQPELLTLASLTYGKFWQRFP